MYIMSFMTAFLELRIQSSLLLLSQDVAVYLCYFGNDNEQYYRPLIQIKPEHDIYPSGSNIQT
jgi:hypothetical protein